MHPTTEFKTRSSQYKEQVIEKSTIPIYHKTKLFYFSENHLPSNKNCYEI